jgi:hypothetical protein
MSESTQDGLTTTTRNEKSESERTREVAPPRAFFPRDARAQTHTQPHLFCSLQHRPRL